MTDPKANSCILRWDPAAIPNTLYPEAYSVGAQSAFTIAAKAVVVGGAKQALLSLGTAAGIRLEVGLTALSEPYVEGTAEVILGDPVTDGEHDFGWVFESDGTVTCVVDSVIWGQNPVSTTANFDRITIGGRSSGGTVWSGGILELYVYDFDDVHSVPGMLGSDVPVIWTPAYWGEDRLIWYKASGVTLTAGKVSLIKDKVNGYQARQANVLYQASLTTDPLLNNRPTIQMVNSWYPIDTFTFPSAPYSVFIVANQKSVVVDWQIFFSSRTLDGLGSQRVALLSNVAGNAGIFRSAMASYSFLGAGSALSGAGTRVFSCANNNVKVYDHTSIVGSSGIFQESDIGGQIAFGGFPTYAGALLKNCDVAEWGILKRETTPEDLVLWRRYLSNWYGSSGW